MLPLIRQCHDSAIAAKTLARSVEKGELSPVSIALSRTINVALLVPIFRELSRAFPGLQLTVRRGSRAEIAEFLKSGEVELAVGGPLGEGWDRLDTHSLFDEPLVLLINSAHKFSNRKDRKSTRLNSSHIQKSRMPSSA